MPTLMTMIGVEALDAEPRGGKRKWEVKEEPGRADAFRKARRSSLVLAIGAGLLLLPAACMSLAGCFLFFPPVLFALGFWFFIRYCMGAKGDFGKPGVWTTGCVSNALGAFAWGAMFVNNLKGHADPEVLAGLALLAAWCAFAAWLSHGVSDFAATAPTASTSR